MLGTRSIILRYGYSHICFLLLWFCCLLMPYIFDISLHVEFISFCTLVIIPLHPGLQSFSFPKIPLNPSHFNIPRFHIFYPLNLTSFQRFAAVIMRIRDPKTTALIFASGKMVVTGAKSEDDSRLASRKYARIIQKLGFNAKFMDFKIQNIVGSCDVKFPIRLEGLAYSHGMFSSVISLPLILLFDTLFATLFAPC